MAGDAGSVADAISAAATEPRRRSDSLSSTRRPASASAREAPRAVLRRGARLRPRREHDVKLVLQRTAIVLQPQQLQRGIERDGLVGGAEPPAQWSCALSHLLELAVEPDRCLLPIENRERVDLA